MSRRIGFVINQLGGVGAGGSDRVISVLANEFAERGWDVDILALTGDTTIDRTLDSRVKVRFEAPIRSGSKVAQVGLRMIRGASLVRSYAKQHPQAVIVSFIAWVNMCTIAGLVGRKHHGPVIVSERTDPASDPGSGAARKLRDAAYRRADALVFQTPDAQAYFTDKLTVPSRVIPNPVSGGLPDWTQPQASIEIVTAARLEAQKNIPLLVAAFAPIAQAHPTAHLRVFGEGKLRSEIQNHIDELGLTDAVTLEGFAADVHQQLSQASMFVMSSDYEGMPNALLEALAMGMPAISVDCPIGGPRMLIEDGVNGILIPTNDAPAMTAAMQRFIDEPTTAATMGSAAAEVRQTHSVGRIVDTWERFINERAEARNING